MGGAGDGCDDNDDGHIWASMHGGLAREKAVWHDGK